MFGQCVVMLAVLAQLLLPAMAARQTLVQGDPLVICTPQGFRSIGVDLAAPDQPQHRHGCDLCCLGHGGRGLLPAVAAVAVPTRAAVHLAEAWPWAPLPAAAARCQRPQGRAPPRFLV